MIVSLWNLKIKRIDSNAADTPVKFQSDQIKQNLYLTAPTFRGIWWLSVLPLSEQRDPGVVQNMAIKIAVWKFQLYNISNR